MSLKSEDKNERIQKPGESNEAWMDRITSPSATALSDPNCTPRANALYSRASVSFEEIVDTSAEVELELAATRRSATSREQTTGASSGPKQGNALTGSVVGSPFNSAIRRNAEAVGPHPSSTPTEQGKP